MDKDNETYPNTEDHKAKGDWNPVWDKLEDMDPEFLEAYLAFRSVPHREGPLPPKFKELILIAINAATTHLYAPGVRRHMQNALKGRRHPRRDSGNHPAHNRHGHSLVQPGDSDPDGRGRKARGVKVRPGACCIRFPDARQRDPGPIRL